MSNKPRSPILPFVEMEDKILVQAASTLGFSAGGSKVGHL